MNTVRDLQRAFLPAVLVVLALSVSACGDDDQTSSTTTTATTSTTDTTPLSSSTSATTTESTTTSSSETVSSTTTAETTSSSTTTASTVAVVYFSTGDGTDCNEVTAFERIVDNSSRPALTAFMELVTGPNATETAAGASSFFSSATADSVRSVTLEDGTLTVDFNDIRSEISNAGTSCGSAAFTSSLNSTAFQFPTVDRTRYLFATSCEDFGEFMQTDICEFDRR